jgi:DNA-binding CsgD family transcriptional regulator
MGPGNEIIRIWSSYLDEADLEEPEPLFDVNSVLYSLPYLYGGFAEWYTLDLLNFSLHFGGGSHENLFYPEMDEVSFESLIQRIHPQDLLWYVNMHYELKLFMDGLEKEQLPAYTFSCLIRICYSSKNRGVHSTQQLWIPLKRTITGKCRFIFIIHTIIPLNTQPWKPVFSILGRNGELSLKNMHIRTPTFRKKDFLTKREQEILKLLKSGNSSKEIGDLLNISKNTVDRHRKNMLAKTGSSNTTELTMRALDQGWIR